MMFKTNQALLDAAAGHNRTLAVLQVGACDGDWEADMTCYDML